MKRRDFIKKSVFAVGSTLLAGGAIKSLAAMSIDDEVSESNESKQDKMKIVVLTGSPRRKKRSSGSAAPCSRTVTPEPLAIS